MHPLAATPISGLGPIPGIVLFIVLVAVLAAGTVWADRVDRANPR